MYYHPDFPFFCKIVPITFKNTVFQLQWKRILQPGSIEEAFQDTQITLFSLLLLFFLY